MRISYIMQFAPGMRLSTASYGVLEEDMSGVTVCDDLETFSDMRSYSAVFQVVVF